MLWVGWGGLFGETGLCYGDAFVRFDRPEAVLMAMAALQRNPLKCTLPDGTTLGFIWTAPEEIKEKVTSDVNFQPPALLVEPVATVCHLGQTSSGNVVCVDVGQQWRLVETVENAVTPDIVDQNLAIGRSRVFHVGIRAGVVWVRLNDISLLLGNV